MKKIIRHIKYFSRKLNAAKVSVYSAQTAFFMFLSIIPLIMLILSLLRQVGSEQFLYDTMTQYTPHVIDRFLDAYLPEITEGGKVSMTILSALILLWSASKGVYSIIGGLNSVYRIRETRNFFTIRLISVFYTVAFIFIIVAALLLVVFGDMLNDLLYNIFPDLKGLVYIVSSLRFIITFVMLVLFFGLIYKALPNGKQKFSDQIPGAVIAGAGWIIFSMLFSFFVDNFGNYENIYGSLTAIIVLLLWMYFCMYILFIGAEINLMITLKINKE